MQVKVTSDFKSLNVFWICKGDARDDEIEYLLNSVAGILRHELSILRLMGEVPFVTFVKGLFYYLSSIVVLSVYCFHFVMFNYGFLIKY